MKTLLLLFLLAFTCGAWAAVPLQPYAIDHSQPGQSLVDLSGQLHAPAGEDGFITLKDGHLVTPDGERFRIWGVNLTGWTKGSSCLPQKEEAARWAEVLASNGINCVRFHFLDLETHLPDKAEAREAHRQRAEARGRRNSVPPPGLIDGSRDDTLVLDSEALDRLDYFIAELKKQGVYSNLNLNVGRQYKAGDDVPDYEDIWVAKGMTYIGERLIELQKDYAQKLLTHYNPYTESEYRHESAVATVEIVNENSIYEFWMRNWLRGVYEPGGTNYQLDFTPYYENRLNVLFNDWLKGTQSPQTLQKLRQETGVVEDAPIPRLRRGEFQEASPLRFHTEADFYFHIEESFLMEMYRFLKHDLGVQSLVIGNADHTYWIPSQPMLRANSMADFVDGHVYWEHPAIWGVRNTPMVSNPLDSTIVKLSRSPMAGMAFTVSEVNHPNPSDYSAEMIPILAAYGAFQDWDGIYFYTFEPKVSEEADRFVSDYFDITLDPVKMTQMKVGSMLFRRADVAPAETTIVRSYSHEQVNETMRMPESERPYFTPGFPESRPLLHGSRIGSLDSQPANQTGTNTEPPYVSDTDELTWSVDDDGTGAVTIDTPRSQALVGFTGVDGFQTKHLAVNVENDFCVITLSSLNNQPIQLSTRLLLTACVRWENTGTQWNADRTNWDTWGHGPTLIEPITGRIIFRELDGAVGILVTPLDGAGQAIGEPIQARRMEYGWEFVAGTPTTTQYLVEVIK